MTNRQRTLLSFGLPTLLIVGILTLWLHSRGGLPLWAGWLVGVNVVAVMLYGLDKWQARGERQRVPEFVLLVVAAAGGSPGAWLGMKWFRHKTRKTSFRVGFWAIVCAQVIAAIAYVWTRYS